MTNISEFFASFGGLIGQGIIDTLLMLFISTALAYVIGLFLGVVLYVTASGSLRPHRILTQSWVGSSIWDVPSHSSFC